MKSEYKGAKRILKGFACSWNGCKSILKTESSFRQDVLFCALCAFGFCFLPLKGMKCFALCISLFFILFAEVVNTAIEVIIDRIGEEYNPLSKKAKDIGSFLVLLSFINFFVFLGFVLKDL